MEEMTMRAVAAVVGWLLVTMLWCSAGHGMGVVHRLDHPVPGQPDWPEGLTELLNSEGRVYGYRVNANEWFFFADGAEAFNAFLAQYAQLEGTALTLTIHPGQGRVDPWDEDQEDIPFGWQVTVLRRGWHRDAPEAEDPDASPYLVSVDLWLGSWLDLDALEAPVNVEVKSGGEIEAFIEAHEARRGNQPAAVGADG
jgi:hypothetical protein